MKTIREKYFGMIFLTSSVAVVTSMSWSRTNIAPVYNSRLNSTFVPNFNEQCLPNFISQGGKSIPSNTASSETSYSSSFLKMTLPLNSAECENGIKFKSCFIRQVPGDGGCLFHSLAVCCSYLKYGKHIEFDDHERLLSSYLRNISIDVLRKNTTVVMEFGQTLSTETILNMVSKMYNLSANEYCESMYRSSTWGGGPEIVALSNYFQRPVHVFQLATTKSPFLRSQFGLKICARFGSPDFDHRAPLRILCADGRFPHISPGQQKEVGDHFLALFPCPPRQGDERRWLPSLSSSSSSSLSTSLPKIHPRGRVRLGLRARAGGLGEGDARGGGEGGKEADEWDLSWVLTGQLTPDNSELDRLPGEVGGGLRLRAGLLGVFLKGVLVAVLTRWLLRSKP